MLVALIYLVVLCAFAAVAYWAVDALGTPQPINRIVKVAVVLVAVLIIIVIALRLLGLDIDAPLAVHALP